MSSPFPCIIYQNPSASITVIDIPRSIELAQGHNTRRLVSTNPLNEAFPSHEPKSSKARAKVGEHSIEDLLIQKYLEFSLEEIKKGHRGDWCLPRVMEHEEELCLKEGKRRNMDEDNHDLDENTVPSTHPPSVHLFATTFFQNLANSPIHIQYNSNMRAIIPANSTMLLGDLLSTKPTFIHHAPKFSLVIMDPPWPNRSAQRKAGYNISNSTSDVRSLLIGLPLEDYMTVDGYLGVWITNKTVFRSLTLEMFTEWGVELVEEWLWLKVTTRGEPIYALDGLWRKPYETLLVGRKGGFKEGEELQKRVLVGVPDLHSRKPSLKCLFEGVLGKKSGEYEALEIFARNMTEGWWGWGNEVLKFQEDECWIDIKEAFSNSS